MTETQKTDSFRGKMMVVVVVGRPTKLLPLLCCRCVLKAEILTYRHWVEVRRGLYDVREKMDLLLYTEPQVR